MTATLGNAGMRGIVPRYGFRPPTTVGVEFHPRQDVPSVDPVYDEVMLQVATEFALRRLRRSRAQIPPGYSMGFICVTDSSAVLITVGAIVQRPAMSWLSATVVVLLVMAPALLFFVRGVWFRPGFSWATWGAATVILLATSTPVAADLAPLILPLMMGCVAMLASPAYAALAFGSASALLAVASATHRLGDTALYVVMLMLGWVVGYLMDVQAQLLVKQQQTQAQLAEHAVADERRRIACEVHDVIAHALSAMMLHVTAARRVLQQDRDVDDAVDALTDAERLGRQATADIRRTVGLLETGPAATAPEPGVDDITGLIDDFVQAGLTVTRRIEGPVEQVSAAVGLGLYRLTQESLANIAKHAADSRADVELVVSRSRALLSVANETPVRVGASAESRDGHGLRGMRQRVESLGGVLDTGPSDHGWLVHAEIPLNQSPNPRPRRCSR
jgi:signal transduction histidine kinase